MVREAVDALLSMPRGLPRPLAKVDVEKIKSRWGDKWSRATYPWPFTASTDYIGNSDWGRPRECVANKLCGNCGEPVEEDDVLLIISNDPGEDYLWEESGPFHEKCARQVFTLCPAMSEQVVTFRNKQGRITKTIKKYEISIGSWDAVAPILNNK